jgi:hypothetical protein
MALVKGGKGDRCGLQIRRVFRLFPSQRLMWKDALPPLASRCVSDHFDLWAFCVWMQQICFLRTLRDSHKEQMQPLPALKCI